MKSLFQTAIECEAAGEFGKAYELLTQCLSDKSHDPGGIAFHRGWCLENGANAEADRERTIDLYRQAAEQANDEALKSKAFFRTGWLLLQQKKYSEAALAFKKASDFSAGAPLHHHIFHSALYWYAVSIECLGRYLEAVSCYERVKYLSPSLAPDSAYRKIICYNQVGNYAAALEECMSFPEHCPQGYDALRYSELFGLMAKEKNLLLRCLAENRRQEKEV